MTGRRIGLGVASVLVSLSITAGDAAAARWTVQHPPSPARLESGALTATSCVSVRMCIAVGSYMDTNGRELALVERFDGVEWRIDPIRIPKQWDATLYAVSCVSVSACTAVGSYDNADGDTLGLAARWNGRSWNRQAVPRPSTTSGMTLLGITCRSRTTCTAVGSPDDSTGEPPVVEHWNGRRWLAQRVEKPGDAFGGYLVDVACASNGQCVAVRGFLSSSTECWVPWVQQEVAGVDGSPEPGIRRLRVAVKWPHRSVVHGGDPVHCCWLRRHRGGDRRRRQPGRRTAGRRRVAQAAHAGSHLS
jgi:hypothetical protein